jgi:hypothetical protein
MGQSNHLSRHHITEKGFKMHEDAVDLCHARLSEQLHEDRFPAQISGGVKDGGLDDDG